jgi:hypothetical protein
MYSEFMFRWHTPLVISPFFVFPENYTKKWNLMEDSPMMVETMAGNNMDSIKYFNSVLLKMKLTDISRVLIL